MYWDTLVQTTQEKINCSEILIKIQWLWFKDSDWKAIENIICERAVILDLICGFCSCFIISKGGYCLWSRNYRQDKLIVLLSYCWLPHGMNELPLLDDPKTCMRWTFISQQKYLDGTHILVGVRGSLIYCTSMRQTIPKPEMCPHLWDVLCRKNRTRDYICTRASWLSSLLLITTYILSDHLKGVTYITEFYTPV